MAKNVDSYIFANFKLIDSSLGIACVCSGAMAVFLSIPLIGLFMALPLGIVSLYQFYSVMKKLLYDSTFGSEAYLYKSLPVSPVEEVYCKVLTGGIALLLQAGTMLAGVTVYYLFVSTGKGPLLANFLQEYVEQGIASADIPLYISLDFLAAAVGSFAQVSALFLVIVMYHCMDLFQTGSSKMKGTAIGLGVILQLLITRFPGMAADAAGLTGSLAVPAGSLVLYAVILIGSLIWTVKLYERKYQLG